jgi:NACalpha-BTF3-like transcription factor
MGIHPNDMGKDCIKNRYNSIPETCFGRSYQPNISPKPDNKDSTSEDTNEQFIPVGDGFILTVNDGVIKIKTSDKSKAEDIYDESIEEQDIRLIMDQTKVSRESAILAYKESNNDIVDAIVSLNFEITI